MKPETKQTHTPTQVYINRKGDYWQVIRYGKNGLTYEIASCLRKEFAEFIVRAVNSNEALVIMLKAAINPIAEAQATHAPDPIAFEKWRKAWLEGVHQILANLNPVEYLGTKYDQV